MPRVSARVYGSVSAAKKRIKRASSAGGGPIRRLKANESAKFRFCQEPEEWVEAEQHYVKETSQFLWCPGDGCEECAKGSRPSRRTLMNAVEVSDGNKVVVVQVVAGLAKQLFQKYERFGTIMDRDYELTREGSGLEDTVYSVDYSGPKRKDLSRFKLHDILEILDADSDSSDGAGDEDAEPRSTKGSGSKGKASAGGLRRKAQDDDEDEYEDDEEDEEGEEQDDFSDLDRSDLKREIKKLDPDFVAKKSQSDDDLRAYLWDLTYAEDSEEDEEDDEEDDDPPRPPRAKTQDRPARRRSRHPDEDEDDGEEEEEDAEKVAPRTRRPSAKPKPRGGLNEFKKSTTSNPAPRKIRRTR